MPEELSNPEWPSVEDITNAVLRHDERIQELIDDKIPFVEVEVDDDEDPEKVEKYFIAPSTEWSDHYKSSYAVSNHRSLLKDFPNWLIDTNEARSEHAVAWPESRIRVMPTYLYNEIKDAFEGLENYPVYNENDQSNLESELQDEAWTEHYRDYFRDELLKRSRIYADEEEDTDGVPLIEKIEQYLESDEAVDEIYYDAIREGSGGEWTEESDGEWHLRVGDLLDHRMGNKTTSFDAIYDTILSKVLGRKFPGYRDPRQAVFPFDAETVVDHLLSRTICPAKCPANIVSEQLSIAAKLMLASIMEGHEYSCVLVHLPKELSEQILGWSQQQIPEETLFVDKDGGKGLEDEPHITVLYGLTEPTPSPTLKHVFAETAPFDVQIGPVSLFRNGDYDVVKLGVRSVELSDLHRRIAESEPNEQTHPEYHAHVTLAYVKPGAGDHLEGHSPWDNPAKMGVSDIDKKGVFTVKTVVFSSSVGDIKKVYALGNRQEHTPA